jgi:hypothetical protein
MDKIGEQAFHNRGSMNRKLEFENLHTTLIIRVAYIKTTFKGWRRGSSSRTPA